MLIAYLCHEKDVFIYPKDGPLIKDEREQQSSTLIHLADSKTGATCRGSLLDLAPFEVMSLFRQNNSGV